MDFMVALSSAVRGSASIWLAPLQRLTVNFLPVLQSMISNLAPLGMVLLPFLNQSSSSVVYFSSSASAASSRRGA